MDKNTIEKYIPLVKSIAITYSHTAIPFDDLVQEGTIGLWEAWKRFDPDKGAKFSTYATYWIKKYILEAISKEHKTSHDAIHLDNEISHNKREVSEDIEHEETVVFPESFPEMEKRVLNLLYGLDGKGSYDLGEIGVKLDLPRERVRQMKEKGLRRLRKLGISLQ